MSHPFQDIYDKIPHVDCKGYCGKDRHNTCCGPIGCTPVEAALIDAYNGKESEWTHVGPGRLIIEPESLTNITCPHLGINGACEVYEVRPVICRLWGATKMLPCPWGCKPKRYLSDREGFALLAEAEHRSLDNPGVIT